MIEIDNLKLNIPTPVEEFFFRDKRYYIKRDDLTHPLFSGNKARKLWFLFYEDLSFFEKIISHGSSQSNAMLSLSYLSKIKNIQFDYYTSHINNFLKQNPHGNYKYALKNGMNIIIGKPPTSFKENELFIPEGGYIDRAEEGIKILAEEIKEWVRKQRIKVDIFLPSGTGTTALYLQKNLPNIKVYTTPCVGDSEYLKKEFLQLCHDEEVHPTILNSDKKYHFAKLYKEFYLLWLELKEKGIEFDLVYDPKGWLTLLYHEDIFENPILYIYQGGILGNESMLPRYQRKYPNISLSNLG